MGDLVRHRAEQEALGAGHALVADDDQVGAALLGDVEDRVGGSPSRAKVSTSTPASSTSLGRLAERRLDVLARVDHPLQVLRRLARLLAQALPGDRLVGGDESSVAPICLASSTACRTAFWPCRTVGPHHDRAEHALHRRDHSRRRCAIITRRDRPPRPHPARRRRRAARRSRGARARARGGRGGHARDRRDARTSATCSRIDPARIFAGRLRRGARRRSRDGGIPLEVLPGRRARDLRGSTDLDDETLRALSLGGGPYLLVECPFSPVSAESSRWCSSCSSAAAASCSPTRSARPAFQRAPARLERLVDDGRARAGHRGLARRRLRPTARAVHVDAAARGPRPRARLRRPRRRSSARRAWPPARGARARPAGHRRAGRVADRGVPAAILAGDELPPRPPLPRRARRPARAARAQSLTIAITALASTSTMIAPAPSRERVTAPRR